MRLSEGIVAAIFGAERPAYDTMILVKCRVGIPKKSMPFRGGERVKVKNLAKKLAVGVLSATFVLALAACAPNGGEQTRSPEEGPEVSFAERQIARAKDTFRSFYDKEELFGAPQSGASVLSSLLSERAEESDSFDGVREAMAGYTLSQQADMKAAFNSYVADIFSYSQVQSSILNEFGEDALTDVYALNYDKVNWTGSYWSSWIESTKLLSAAFAGADVDNGNVYCTQAHVANRVLVMADLEYFYRSDGDMGVTTLNWRDNGKFEYHFCSAGTYEILQAYGSYQTDGGINLTSFNFIQKNGQLKSSDCSEEDKQLVYRFVNSEIARIEGKIGDLQEQNGRERDLQGDEETENRESHVGVCSVEMDFEILSRMLLK